MSLPTSVMARQLTSLSRHVPLLLAVTMFFHAVPSTVAEEDATVGVSVYPPRLTRETGKSGEAGCTLSDGVTGTRTWLNPNGTTVAASGNDSSSSSTRISFDADSGTLTLSDLWVNDTGLYTCVLNYTGPDDVIECAEGLACNGTVELKVYVMPDYLTDGIIVLIINVVLGAVFAGCLIRSAIVDRRRLRKYGQKL